MHVTNLEFKDGRKASGVLWTWRPKEGYVEINGISGDGFSDDDYYDLIKIRLSDLASLVTLQERTTANGPLVDEDQLQRARADGWTGT